MGLSRVIRTTLYAVALCTAVMMPAGAQENVPASPATTRATHRSFIQLREPPANGKVKPAFEFAGRTEARAVVTVEAFSSDDPHGGRHAAPSFRKQTRADQRGNFAIEVTIAEPNAYVHVHASAVAPDGSSAEATKSFAVAH